MEKTYFGDLSIIGMKGCDKFLSKVDSYLHEWRSDKQGSYLVDAECPRFGSGEGKAIIHESLRGHDTYIFADVFNYGVTSDEPRRSFYGHQAYDLRGWR